MPIASKAFAGCRCCRSVARQQGLAVVDWEHMTQGLPFYEYLGDDYHPSMAANLTYMNLFLNILFQHMNTKA